MFKVNNKDTKRHWRRSGVFYANFDQFHMLKHANTWNYEDQL